eukprot:gene3012-3460_t
MEITFETATTDQHFKQILQLQQQNLYNRLSVEQQGEQGFVFAEHTLDLLKTMASHLPQVIALHQDQVIGYSLAMTSGMKYILPSLIPMFEQFERMDYKGKPLSAYRFMVGGQVCVHPLFRGKGLLEKLYQQSRDRLPAGYELCVTEISTRNPKSLKAHEKMGFELSGSYQDTKELWNVVVWAFE